MEPYPEEQSLAAAITEIRDALIAVSTSITILNQSLPALRSEVDDKVNAALDEAQAVEDRAEKTTKKITAVIMAPIIVLLFLVGAVLFSSYQTKQSADIVKDCTTAGGQCFQENRKTLSVSIAQINENTSKEIRAALEENHQDHNETSYLFCVALTNAELPAPAECAPILEAGPPPSLGK